MIKKLIEKIINLLFSKYLLKQKQLNESFNRNKLRGDYIKKWITLMI